MLTTTIVINGWHDFTTTSISMKLEILESSLMQRPTTNVKERLRKAYEDYVQTTDEGQELIRVNYGQPTWGHLLLVPNEYLETYGIRRLDATLSTIVLDADDVKIDTKPRKDTTHENRT